MDCENCSKCCESISLPLIWQGVDKNTRRWIKYHNLSIKKINNELHIDIPIKCSKLIDNRCSIYEKRPDVCKEYDCQDELTKKFL